LVQVYLESRGYEVASATDGNRALDMGASGEYDLLILDVHMPLYGGLEVLQNPEPDDVDPALPPNGGG
jgi:CheY-like chemotaxis protein